MDAPTSSQSRSRWLAVLRWVVIAGVLVLVGASYGQLDLLVNWVAKFC